MLRARYIWLVLAVLAAGAQALMVFDTWGSVLTPASYREFSLRYMNRIVDELDTGSGENRIPTILFTKGAGEMLADMVGTGCDALPVIATLDGALAVEPRARPRPEAQRGVRAVPRTPRRRLPAPPHPTHQHRTR